MNIKRITLILIPLNIILAFYVYNSINSEIDFNRQAKERIAENVQKLKDLRTLQIAYKKENNAYAGSIIMNIKIISRKRINKCRINIPIFS